MTLFRRLGCTLVLGLTLVACGTPPPPQPPAGALCRSLQAEQAGKLIRPVGGTLTIARQPFALHLSDPGSIHGIHVALDARLSKVLLAANSPEIWLSAGDVMAGEPNLLTVNGDHKLFASDARQTAFVAAFGQRSVALLGPAGTSHASPALAGQVPRNTWFDKTKGSRPHVYPVRTIGELPVDRTTMPELHLVSFSAAQGFPSTPMAFFSRSTWSTCVVRFAR